MRPLVGGIGVRDGFPPAGQAQHPQVQQPEPLPRLLGPRLVEVLRQQLAGVGVGGGARRPGIPRGLGQPLEPDGVEVGPERVDHPFPVQ